MNMHALDLETDAQAAIVETEALAQKGFTPGEVVFLLRLREWYQHGGSDRADLVRHLEFLRFLVAKGKLSL